MQTLEAELGKSFTGLTGGKCSVSIMKFSAPENPGRRTTLRYYLKLAVQTSEPLLSDKEFYEDAPAQ